MFSQLTKQDLNLFIFSPYDDYLLRGPTVVMQREVKVRLGQSPPATENRYHWGLEVRLGLQVTRQTGSISLSTV